MKHTEKYKEGYRYYVYIAPGHIEYFKYRWEAVFCAENNGCKVKELL